MDKSFILKTFNKHLIEFMDDIITVFPREVDLLTSRTFIQGVLKVKKKIVIEYWYQYVYLIYKSQIDEGNFDYFLNKDYNKDTEDNDILNGIEKMRNKIRELSDDNKKKSIEYVKNLSKLSNIYFN
tara:strand:+ start:11675 stop:12052 length:378 start_codon:yes stop_codon:yes gene_type:complete